MPQLFFLHHLDTLSDGTCGDPVCEQDQYDCALSHIVADSCQLMWRKFI